MRRVLIVTTAIVALVVSPAGAQLVGQPSGQGGAAPPLQPNVSTAPPTVQTTPGTSQSQDSTLQLEGSASEFRGGTTSPFSPYSPSPRVRALNQLTRPPVGADRGQAEHPAGPLR
jgi:hypothetical protein